MNNNFVTADENTAHNDIARILEELININEGQLQPGEPLTDAQCNLALEISSLNASNSRMLNEYIYALSTKDALRVIKVMEQIGARDSSTCSSMMGAVYRKAIRSRIVAAAFSIIDLTTKIFGTQAVLFLFLAPTSFFNSVILILCQITLFLNFPILLSLPAIIGVEMLFYGVRQFLETIAPVVDHVIKKYDDNAVKHYGHINSLRYRPEGFFQRLELFISKRIITPVSNKFSVTSLRSMGKVAQFGFMVAVMFTPIIPSIAVVLLPLAGLSFVVDSVAKVLLVPHKYKETHALDESLCLSQIDNSMAPNQEDLENLHSLTPDNKIRFVNLCNEIVTSLKEALTSKSFINTYRTLHLFEGKLGHINDALENDIDQLQDNRSILVIRSCISGAGMLSIPGSKSIMDMPDLSENQEKVVRNIITNLETMRDYVQSKLPATIAVQDNPQSIMTYQFNKYITAAELMARKRIHDKSVIRIERRWLLTNGG